MRRPQVLPRACTKRATLIELSQLGGCEPEFFGQIRHRSDRVLLIARQKDDPVAALDDRIGRQDGRNQVVETFHDLSADLLMFPERDRKDDCVGLECIPQRLGDDRGSNRPSLRCQRLGRPATREGHFEVLTGKGVGEGKRACKRYRPLVGKVGD